MKDYRTNTIHWAQDMLQRDDWVILDTETTGMNDLDEVIEISIIDKHETILLDTLLRPQVPIRPGAGRVHRIKPEMLKAAPVFSDISEQIIKIIRNFPFMVIYNASFDSRMLWQTAKKYNRKLPEFSSHCLMKLFAVYYGGRYGRWKKLEEAARLMGVQVKGAHRSLADVKTTLALLKAIAEG